MKRRLVVISLALAAIATTTAILAVPPVVNSMSDPALLTLDIQAGEPIGDAMARSTMSIEVPVALDMQILPLPPLAPWDGKAHYQVALQTGGEHAIAIPWVPAGGKIVMSFGVIDEIDLDYYHFDRSRADGEVKDGTSATDADIEGILAIYAALQAVEPRAPDIVSCYRNRIPIEFLEKDRRDSENGECEDVVRLANRQSPDELRLALANFLNATAEADRSAPDGFGDAPHVLNLGQWWLPNGNLVGLTVVPERDISSRDASTRLHLYINVREFFAAAISRLVQVCYDQQAIFPDKMKYSQEQAARIFHGLYDDIYPPVVDGEVISDLGALALLDWSRMSDTYWNDAGTRKGFCARLEELRKEAGYAGPVAPLR